MLLLAMVACTAKPPPEEPTRTRAATSSSEQANVVRNVVRQNFLEALGTVEPPFRLLDVRYRFSSAPNGMILKQRPPAGTVIDPTLLVIKIRVVVARHRN
jgi:beta-lactam-binding protein with PASTA domain